MQKVVHSCVHTCNSVLCGAETGGLLEPDGCYPSSSLSVRPCLKEKERMIKHDTQCLLVEDVVDGGTPMYVHTPHTNNNL